MPTPELDQSTLTVCYNGACPVCRAEITHYRRESAGSAALRFLDVAADPLAAASCGLAGDVGFRRLHTVAADGNVVGGVGAFMAVWERLPRYRWLARLLRWPALRACAEWAYERVAAPALFALYRRRQDRRSQPM